MINVCLVCQRRRYIETPANDKALSHGICESAMCLWAYMTKNMIGVTASEFINDFRKIRKSNNKDYNNVVLKIYSTGYSIRRSIHKPSGRPCVYRRSPLRRMS